MQTTVPDQFSFENGFVTLGSLVQHYGHVVRTVAQKFFKQYKKFLSYEDVDDLTQSALMRLPSVVKNYEKHRNDVVFEQFLHAALKNIFIDILKRHVRRSQFSQDFIRHKIYGEEEVFIEDDVHDQRAKVRKALKNLEFMDINMAEVTFDYYFEEMSDPEIAAQRNLTKIQVWRLRQKALHALHELMEDQGETV